MAIGPTIENLRKKRAEEAALLKMLYALPTPTGGFDVNTPAERRQLAEIGLRGGEPYSDGRMDYGRQRPVQETIDVMPQQPAEFYAREVSRDLFGERATNDLFGYPQGTGNLVGDILTGGGMLGAIGATAPLTAWDAGAAAARGDYGDAALKSAFSLLEGAQLGELATGARGLRAVANEFPEAAQKVGQRVRGFLADESGSLPLGKPTLDVSRRDASDIFGAGSERVRYTDPNSGGTIEVVVRPDGSASVLELEVPEAFRGRGIGQTLQARALQDFPKMGGQVSSKAAATTAYRLGRRPQGNPDATLDDVFAAIDDMSSVNMVSPAMQTAPTQTRGFLAGESGSVPLPFSSTLPAPRNEAEAIAKEILELRATGNVDAVTESMMDAADPQYMYTYTPLAMDEASRLARAREIGFGKNRYHGNNSEVSGFIGSVFSSDSPTVASTYNRGMLDAQIYPIMVRGGPMGDVTVEGAGSNWNQLSPEMVDDIAVARTSALYPDEITGKLSTRGIEKAAKFEGRSGVTFKDISDLGPGFDSQKFKRLGYTPEQEAAMRQQYLTDLSKPSEVDVRLYPNLVRSRFARFDPMFAHLRNLSAGIAPFGLLALQPNEEQY